MQNITIPWWNVDLGEKAAQAAYDAVANRNMSLGSITVDLENRLAELLNVPHVVATSSGTASLTMALLEAEIGSGDEVIVPNRTWIATAHAPMLLGARTILADVQTDRPLLCPKAFEKAITSRTKAVIPVHLNGRKADMNAIMSIAKKHKIHVIEDAAQAFYVPSKEGYLGTLTRAGCFSLSIGKAITCGQGGFIATHDPTIAHRLKLLRTHGTADIHTSKWEMLGGNFRMWDLPAAIALTQLETLPQRLTNILRVYQRYVKGLKNLACVTIVPVNIEDNEIPLYVEVLCPTRDNLISWLKNHGVQARPLHSDLNEAPQFSYNTQQYTNSKVYGKQCMVLPCGPDRSNEDIDIVIELLHEYENSYQHMK